MAPFADFKVGVKDYGKSKVVSLKSLVAGDEAIVVLWGGGPAPDNKPLDITQTPAVCDVIELPPLTTINRRFRLIGRNMGSGVLEGKHAGAPWAILVLSVTAGPPSPPKATPTDLQYNGQTLTWPARKQTYKATSGLPPDKAGGEDWRDSKYFCFKDHGPVPEGIYTLSTKVDPDTYADSVGDPECRILPGGPIQKIPRGTQAGACEPYWANWGENRVALQPADESTRTACSPLRDGFYLHDSTKGFSHGCIEVQGQFFTDLYDFAKSSKGKRMTIGVKYAHQSTQGGTKVTTP